MPQTPDRFNGVSDQEGIDFDESPDGFADAEGKLRYKSGRFSAYDQVGEYDPRNDEKVQISSGDTTPDYLEPKLVEGANVTITKQNVGANETLEIATSFAAPTCCGQVLMSVDAATFTPQLPLTSLTGGWLVNGNGNLLVVG